MADLERQGWIVHVKLGSKIRYWCPCPRRHSRWVETDPARGGTTELMRLHLGRSTCFRDEEVDR